MHINVLCKIIPRQIKVQQAVNIIRETVEELILKCKEMVEKEREKIDDEDYVNDADPSILRFLLASREEVTSQQLRDDLLSMLVARHETTGSVLTWTDSIIRKMTCDEDVRK
nr:carotene epsilon-monooxygenase, chloroplastic [Tanacetum cinerariifolium]